MEAFPMGQRSELWAVLAERGSHKAILHVGNKGGGEQGDLW